MGINPADFAGAIWGSQEIRKILKKEEKKGESKVAKAIQNYHLAHVEAKKAIAEALGNELGAKVDPKSELVENAVNTLSLGKIFEDRGGAEYLVPSLKMQLQKYEVDSQEAHSAVAGELSKGSKGQVPRDDKVVQFDLDMISLKTTEDPKLLF